MKLILLLLFLSSIVLSFAQEKPVLVVSKGHHQAINCMDISPDGKTIVSGANDNLIKVYDLNVKQELNTFIEHDRQVDLVQFSPDGKYIVSTSSQQLLIHSHPEGNLVHEIPLKNLIGNYNFQITKENLIYLGYPTGLKVFDIKSGNLIKTLPIKSRNLEFLLDGETIITNATNDSKEVGIGYYSSIDGSRIDFVPVKGLVLNDYHISENGKKIAFAIDLSTIGILNLETKKVQTRISVGPSVIHTFKLNPDASELITTAYDGHVVFRNTENGNVIRDVKDISPSGDPYSMAMGLSAIDFSENGSVFALAYTDLKDSRANYTVEWYEYESLKPIGKYAGDVKISLSIGIDHTGTVLSTGTIGSSMGVKCLDLKKGSQTAFIPGTAYMGTGGKYLAAVNNPIKENSQPRLEIYSMPSVTLYKSFDLYGFAQIGISPSGKYVYGLDQDYIPNDDPTKVKVTPYIRIWNIETGKEVVHIKRDLQTMPRDVIFSLDETKVYISYPKSIETVELSSNKVINSTPITTVLDYNNSISPDGKSIVAFSGFSIVGIDVETGANSNLFELDYLTIPFATSFSKDHSLFGVSVLRANEVKPYRVLVYDWKTKELVCELIGHNDIIRQITFDNKNRNAYSVDDNGVILMWDLKECKARGSFLALGEEDYIIQSPEGYYKASKGNIASVGFRQNGSLYTFDQFDLRYNRPDKVLESLGLAHEEQVAMYHKAYKKRLRRMGFTIDGFSKNLHAPEIELLDVKEIPLKTSNDFIEVEILASDESIPLDRLNVTVNGIPIYGRLGKDLTKLSALEYRSKLKIPLTIDRNQVQLSVMNKDGTESLRKSFSLICEKPLIKPNLYIIAVGVKSFQDSTMNLTYSDKDAEDFSNLFSSKENSVFNEVHVNLLTNENVTKEEVTKTRSILENSEIDDQVILYYSGHGLLDDEFDYYLSTYDVNFSDPSKRGLAFDKFKDLVDGIPARKRLVLVDACHSGEIDKEDVSYTPVSKVEDNTLVTKAFKEKGFLTIGLENSFELMKELFVELRKESGATIIASSAGKEYSLEGDEWNNGVFTFALKEGLIGLKADANADKKISVSELKSYLFVRVEELTEGKQTPTVRRENLQHNSVIY